MEWKMVPGFPAYEVSERGKLRKTDTHYEVTIRGRFARLWNEGVMVRYEVQDLIALAFAPPRPTNSRGSIPPRTSPRLQPKPLVVAKKKQRKRKPRKRLPKPMPFNSSAFYKPQKSKGQVPRMNLSFCPWSTAKIEGTALGADPVLGF